MSGSTYTSIFNNPDPDDLRRLDEQAAKVEALLANAESELLYDFLDWMRRSGYQIVYWGSPDHTYRTTVYNRKPLADEYLAQREATL